jgi:hypothetical protein
MSDSASIEWVKVFAGIDNAPVVAAALASLGLSPKVMRSHGPRSGFDVLVSRDQAPEAIRFLGQTPGTTWAAVRPELEGSLMAWYYACPDRTSA